MVEHCTIWPNKIVLEEKKEIVQIKKPKIKTATTNTEEQTKKLRKQKRGRKDFLYSTKTRTIGEH